MTAEQRAEKIKIFSLLLPEKEQIALLDELTKRTYEERAKQPKPSPEELNAKILKVNASIEPNDITMNEIVEECRKVRKERYERKQSHS